MAFVFTIFENSPLFSLFYWTGPKRLSHALPKSCIISTHETFKGINAILLKTAGRNGLNQFRPVIQVFPGGESVVDLNVPSSPQVTNQADADTAE